MTETISMDADQQDIMWLLAIGIFADKRIFASEVEVFVKSVARIRMSKEQQSLPSEAKALMWFEMHKDIVKSKFSLPRSEFDAWFIPILKRVAKTADKSALAHILDMIFRADGDLHVSEVALMALIKREWDLD